MSLIPRPRHPEDPSEPYDFAAWDAEQFQRAGNILRQLTQRRDGEASMRSAVLALYFKDMGIEE